MAPPFPLLLRHLLACFSSSSFFFIHHIHHINHHIKNFISIIHIINDSNDSTIQNDLIFSFIIIHHLIHHGVGVVWCGCGGCVGVWVGVWVTRGGSDSLRGPARGCAPPPFFKKKSTQPQRGLGKRVPNLKEGWEKNTQSVIFRTT